MKNEKKKISKKMRPKSDYYNEIIVEPAEKLLKALMEAETKDREVASKFSKSARKTVIHR